MLFHAFKSQEERLNYGCSVFVEIQFCNMPIRTSTKALVDVENIQNWKDDSLYVDDENTFYQEYSSIFDCGTYNNLCVGTVDIYGINYYAPSLIDSIIEKIHIKRPTDYEVIVDWLIKSKSHNGFYILGI